MLLPVRVAVSGGVEGLPDPWPGDLPEPDLAEGRELDAGVEPLVEPTAVVPEEPGRKETVDTSASPPAAVLRPVPSAEPVEAELAAPQAPAPAVLRSAISDACSSSDSR